MNEDRRYDETRPKMLPVTGNELQSLFASNADIGHRIFVDIDLNGLVARQSIFPGAIFRGCQITQCDFSRSDFEGVRFEKCKIVETSFESCDIRSALFAECDIIDCNFKDVYFSDNIVKGGRLKASSFDHATMTGNQFISVRISGISNARSTMLHNDFLFSELDDTKFGDCTALYSYFQDCTFTRFGINADSLGLSYGLTSRDLESANLIFLGRDEQKPVDTNLVNQLIAEFETRQWWLHATFVRLNFHQIAPLAGWSTLFGYLENAIRAGGIRLDDVSFVLHVAERLSTVAQLPFFPIVSAHDALADIRLDDDEVTTEARALQRLKIGLISLIGSMQERFLEGAAQLSELAGDSVAILELVFEQKPESHASEYIEYLIHQIAVAPAPLRSLGGRPGSWLETIQTVVATAFALYTILFLIEGSLIRLLLIRARLGQLTAPKVPKKFIEKANDPRQVLPHDLLKVMRPLIDGLSKGSLRVPERKSGLTGKNLREIAVKSLAD